MTLKDFFEFTDKQDEIDTLAFEAMEWYDQNIEEIWLMYQLSLSSISENWITYKGADGGEPFYFSLEPQFVFDMEYRERFKKKFLEKKAKEEELRRLKKEAELTKTEEEERKRYEELRSKYEKD